LKEHIVDNCPKLVAKTAKEGTTSTTTSSSTPTKTKHWTKTPPAEGHPEVKTATKDNVTSEFKWCSRCKKWQTGVKAHTTSEHISKKGTTNPTAHAAEISTQEGTYSVGFWHADLHSGDLDDPMDLDEQTWSIIDFYEENENNPMEAYETYNPPEEYTGMKNYLPNDHPPGIADYAMYNTLFPEEPLRFEGELVPAFNRYMPSYKEGCHAQDLEYGWKAIEQEYPIEMEGLRTLAYFVNWNNQVKDYPRCM
jgi:hypothetical protein